MTEQPALDSNLVNGRPHGIGDNRSLFSLRHTDVAHMIPEAGYSACVARGWTLDSQQDVLEAHSLQLRRIRWSGIVSP